MYYTLAQRIAHILRMILAWILAFAIFGFFRLYGIGDLPHVHLNGAFNLADFALQLLLAAVITGILYGGVDLLLDRPAIQRRSYGFILTLKIGLHVLIVVAVLVALASVRVRLGIIGEGYFDPDVPTGNFARIVFNKTFYVFLVFFAMASTIMDMYQQIKQKFGRRVFTEMMTGRYHKPKESERIFMFIDLKSSVRLAEELGHVQYSSLLQDCYYDLNTQVIRYGARVYQYVGDQAVLHWSIREGTLNSNCLRCFFGFLDRLEKRRAYYQQRYGLQPYFKGGAHSGRVTVAEIGLFKREIAFHGDVVNTTSRIHDQANRFRQRLLISKDIFDQVGRDPEFHFEYIGDQVLKGKHQSMELYGVRPGKAGSWVQDVDGQAGVVAEMF